MSTKDTKSACLDTSERGQATPHSPHMPSLGCTGGRATPAPCSWRGHGLCGGPVAYLVGVSSRTEHRSRPVGQPEIVTAPTQGHSASWRTGHMPYHPSVAYSGNTRPSSGPGVSPSVRATTWPSDGALSPESSLAVPLSTYSSACFDIPHGLTWTQYSRMD